MDKIYYNLENSLSKVSKDFEQVTFDNIYLIKGPKLKNLYKIYLNPAFLKILRPYVGNAMEGVQGLVYAVIIYHLMRNMPEVSEDFLPINLHGIPALNEEQNARIEADLDPSDEHRRLAKFLKALIYLHCICPMTRMKGVAVFVGQLLEGNPDPQLRLYRFGGAIPPRTQRRIIIYEYLWNPTRRVRAVRANKRSYEQVSDDDQPVEHQPPSETSRTIVSSDDTFDIASLISDLNAFDSPIILSPEEEDYWRTVLIGEDSDSEKEEERKDINNDDWNSTVNDHDQDYSDFVSSKRKRSSSEF